MGKTIAEKIMSAKSHTDAKAGELVLADVDFMMGHDFNAAMTFQVLHEMGATAAAKPERTYFVFDHAVPAPSEGYARIHQMVEKNIRAFGLGCYPPGEGICHQLIPERGHIRPGDLAVGSDSHTCTYGALNAFSTGLGSTDLAVAIMTGKLWFKVPGTFRINYNGGIPKGVYAKDLILYTIGLVGSSGATYRAVEYCGRAISELSVEGRMTMSNMAIEMGGKAGIAPFDEKTAEWLRGRADGDWRPVEADEDAEYERVIDIDVTRLRPQIAKPHRVDNTCGVDELEGMEVQSAFIGACTNGRIEDLRAAAGILEGKHIHKNVKLYIIPASKRVYLQAISEGLISIFLNAGANVESPSCGPCAGICGGVPGDGEKMISTANRNFRGRAGNPESEVYLASPATVACSAICGCVANPQKLL